MSRYFVVHLTLTRALDAVELVHLNNWFPLGAAVNTRRDPLDDPVNNPIPNPETDREFGYVHSVVQAARITDAGEWLGNAVREVLSAFGPVDDDPVDHVVTRRLYAVPESVLDVVRDALTAKDRRLTPYPPDDVNWEPFVCPACDTVNRAPEDVEHKYCARCHWFTGDPVVGGQYPTLFTAHGKTAPPHPLGDD